MGGVHGAAAEGTNLAETPVTVHATVTMSKQQRRTDNAMILLDPRASRFREMPYSSVKPRRMPILSKPFQYRIS